MTSQKSRKVNDEGELNQLNSHKIENDPCSPRQNRKILHNPSREEYEQVEKMAGKAIEAAMTAVVVRRCWSCQRRFVKDRGCDAVPCVCGAVTCYRCGESMAFRHWCQRELPRASRRAVRRAARHARTRLLLSHPGLTFKYDPSRKLWRKRARKV